MIPVIDLAVWFSPLPMATLAELFILYAIAIRMLKLGSA